jgi:hypothetical protein
MSAPLVLHSGAQAALQMDRFWFDLIAFAGHWTGAAGRASSRAGRLL